jgi:hypothetical protein
MLRASAHRNDKREFVELLGFVEFLVFMGFVESIEMIRLLRPDRSRLATQDSSEPRYLKIFTAVEAVVSAGSG